MKLVIPKLEEYFDYLTNSTREKDKIRLEIVKKELGKR